ncbi:GxxExxY protein [Candidatus Berkelbacteria bacterium CG10_big_fil_rev_8_21_14_0_10_43_13]|uniref:GxxExxY protein n=1 Tax=Candidatus Berkelbacteria bacterium CG10_big_fil_rev_8_21_14_0_10_43_13 TaxID=1974514 RepID=A0A2H0W757_9BACT|nr:MAG: GxxExxY protein [Candidatus Berkelbacteria bacterium CG10_big_fil_rev_8_21_14_0_10_43_13]
MDYSITDLVTRIITDGKTVDFADGDLTSEIIKCAFEVYNSLGYGLPERIYQKAMATALSHRNIKFKRENCGKVEFEGEVISRYFLDFLVEERVAVEFKVRNEIYQKDINQLLNYLKMKKIKVGLLLIISKKGVLIRRVVN